MEEETAIAWPAPKRATIAPVFMPNWACPGRCAFCSQRIQTGSDASPKDLDKLLAEAERGLLNRPGEPPELAFYGGTFTALPEPAWRKCLDFARSARDRGLISGFRCSTRPDTLSPRRLREAREAGCRLIELGIQTFNDRALEKSGRGLRGEDNARALELCAEHDLPAGAHLMSGLPGSGPGDFVADVEKSLGLGCACLRFHPCLTLAGSPLEKLWRSGRYSPPGLSETLDLLARGLLLAQRKGTPVIRVGVAPEAGLREAVLAGPWHPALGSRAMGRAMLLAAREACTPSLKISELSLPRRARGHWLGDKGELAEAWSALGVQRERVRWHDEQKIILKLGADVPGQ